MIKTRKAFTLIEVLISITLFSIVVIFLYQSIDITQKSNDFYSKKLKIQQDTNSLKKMFFLDLIKKSKNNDPKKSSFSLQIDDDKNSILQFKSLNTYHNPFYNHITYFVSKEKNLIRVESKTKFNKTKLTDDFFDTAYVDIVYSDVRKFKIEKNNEFNKINIYIDNSKLNKILFSHLI